MTRCDWNHVAHIGISIIKEQVQRLQGPITLRRIFYLFVSNGLIENKHSHYTRLSQISSRWRKEGLLDWRYITDETRETIDPPIYPVEYLRLPEPKDFMNDPTPEQDNYIEVWVEKAGNIPILRPICEKFFVRLINAGGNASDTFKHQVAHRLMKYENDMPCYILYISDMDPSGEHMPIHLNEWLRENYDIRVHVNKIILTGQQIEDFNLLKIAKDYSGTHKKQHVQDFLKKYGSIQVEIDAMDISDIQNITEEHLSSFISLDIIESVKQESIEQATIRLNELLEVE